MPCATGAVKGPYRVPEEFGKVKMYLQVAGCGVRDAGNESLIQVQAYKIGRQGAVRRSKGAAGR